MCNRLKIICPRPGNPNRITSLRFCVKPVAHRSGDFIYQSAIVKKTSLKKRFWAKVNKNGSVQNHVPRIGKCWEWTASLWKGYGRISKKRAHRASWEIHKGEIPKGKQVLHKCDNRKCIRPSHLFLGTDKDNAADRDAKGRRQPPKGEQNGFHKLTSGEILLIRKVFGTMTQVKIAKLFGTHRGNVSKIGNRKVWKHIL